MSGGQEGGNSMDEKIYEDYENFQRPCPDCKEDPHFNRHYHLNKRLVRMIGLEAALLLTDLINTENRLEINGKLPEDKWFYKTESDRKKDTGINIYRQSKAINLLKKKGWIKTKRKGLPPKIYFYICFESIYKDLIRNRRNK